MQNEIRNNEWRRGLVRGVTHPTVLKALGYLRENYQRRVKLIDVATHCNISHKHLCKVFRQHTGMTVSQYLLEVRVGRATKLLGADEMSVKEICYKTGFGSIAQFNRAFRQRTGVTATQYRDCVRRDGRGGNGAG